MRRHVAAHRCVDFSFILGRSLSNVETLLEAAAELVRQGCTAIAVITRFPEDDSEEEKELFALYRQGQGVDAIAGSLSCLSFYTLLIPIL